MSTEYYHDVICMADVQDTNDKLYTQKDIVLIETSIIYFHEKLYITEKQKLSFNLPLVIILGTHHCGKEPYELFKCRGPSQDFLCHPDYAELVVAICFRQL